MIEIADIINAVSELSSISYYDLVFSKKYGPERFVITHIIKTECPFLKEEYAALSYRTHASMNYSIPAIETKIKDDESLCSLEDKVREKLALPLMKYKIPPSLQLFGFIRTEEEEQLIQRAIKNSVAFMNKNYK